MMTTAPASVADRRASTLWIMLLTLASTAATLEFACATPFAALAALAATQMRARDGVVLMLAVWAANQAVGFSVLDYPVDAKTIAWGVGIGLAAVAGIPAARGAIAWFGRPNELTRIAIAYIAATLAFKLVILLFALVLGGVATTLSPSVNARLLMIDLAFLIGLWLLYRGLVLAGVPAARGGRALPA